MWEHITDDLLPQFLISNVCGVSGCCYMELKWYWIGIGRLMTSDFMQRISGSNGICVRESGIVCMHPGKLHVCHKCIYKVNQSQTSANIGH